MSDARWQPVIGLEIHVQLRTRTKLLCGCEVSFEAAPNTRVCPVCLALPGALPVLNTHAVELAARAALGLNCALHEVSTFERKNYFYPDLPKGYQITQFERPLATGGELRWHDRERGVRIRRVHVEEDAGRSFHDRFPHRTAIDLNRAGVPLIEIVTEPDLHDPADARLFLTRLKRLLQYLDVSDCDLEKGSLRVDTNVSVRRVGDDALHTKTEVKNLNSFANVERALRFEIARQARIRDAGGSILAETLLWDADAGIAKSMRTKEETEQYRYFQEPDLPPLLLPAARIAAIRDALPERPWEREQRFMRTLGLPEYDADVLTAQPDLADYFEQVADASGDAKLASNWVMTEVMAWRNERDTDALPMPATRLAALIRLVRDGRISNRVARLVFAEAAARDVEPEEIVGERGWSQLSDPAQLLAIIDPLLADHPDQVARYRKGEDRLFDWFIGRIMRASDGRADPQGAAELLRDRLGC